jgi:hypothetical protein
LNRLDHRKSLLTSLFQREGFPSLEKRGQGRFLTTCSGNYETIHTASNLSKKGLMRQFGQKINRNFQFELKGTHVDKKISDRINRIDRRRHKNVASRIRRNL